MRRQLVEQAPKNRPCAGFNLGKLQALQLQQQPVNLPLLPYQHVVETIDGVIHEREFYLQLIDAGQNRWGQVSLFSLPGSGCKADSPRAISRLTWEIDKPDAVARAVIVRPPL
jgi:hypothetical protein